MCTLILWEIKPKTVSIRKQNLKFFIYPIIESTADMAFSMIFHTELRYPCETLNIRMELWRFFFIHPKG